MAQLAQNALPVLNLANMVLHAKDLSRISAEVFEKRLDFLPVLRWQGRLTTGLIQKIRSTWPLRFKKTRQVGLGPKKLPLPRPGMHSKTVLLKTFNKTRFHLDLEGRAKK